MKIGPADNGDMPQKPDNEGRCRVDANPDEIEKADENAADDPETREEITGFENRPEKIKQARERIESGYYDSPEVKNEIARRLTDDFAG